MSVGFHESQITFGFHESLVTGHESLFITQGGTHKNMPRTVGIDLGTTYSLIAF